MKTEQFPLTITEKGVSAVIRKTSKVKGQGVFDYFIVEYFLLGKRKQVWRSDIEAAKEVAREACLKISNGVQSAIELRDSDRLAYLRSIETIRASCLIT